MEEQILVQSDNNYEFVKFAASPMGHGHVLSLNKWIYKVDGIVLNKTSCAFAVWEMDTWDSFVIVQECVVLMIHHRLLHKVRSVLPGGHSRGMEGEKKEELPPVNKQDDSANESSHGNGGESKDQKGQQKDHLNDTYTTVTQPGTVQASVTIALRTIPVYLKNGTKRIKVNELLDDASTN